MPISKIPVGAIQSGTIATTQIADNAITTVKILNDNVTSAKIPNSAVGSTELSTDSIRGLSANNSDTILLNGTDGAGANSGDALVLDGTDNSSTNANDRILFDETFNPSTFNIGSGTSGQALLVAANGGFEFGTGGEKNEIYWAAYASTDQTNLTNNTLYTVIYNNVRSQSSHNGYDTSTGKFTCPTGGDGIYDISGMVTIGGSGTANNHTRSLYNWIYINGSNGRARAGSFMIGDYYEGTQGSNSPVRLIYPLVAGDTVEIKGQAYGNNHSYDHSTNLSFFGGFRILAGTFSVG
jgi:hypothetical protein